MYLQAHLSTDDISVDDMKEVIVKRLKKEKEDYPPKTTSALRSKLVRNYPTTMALISCYYNENSVRVNSYWAGDSHCYLWTKKGFFQISLDDLEVNEDPMGNLHNDSPISNCICEDREFTIHHKEITFPKEPIVILCATDGCFGYYQTPMHFEYLLKSCLQKSNDVEKWKTLIRDEIQEITGDDTSLSLLAIGFSSFNDLKEMILPSEIEGFSEIHKREKEILELKEWLRKSQEEYQNELKKGWELYKQSYMKYINEDIDGNA